MNTEAHPYRQKSKVIRYIGLILFVFIAWQTYSFFFPFYGCFFNQQKWIEAGTYIKGTTESEQYKRESARVCMLGHAKFKMSEFKTEEEVRALLGAPDSRTMGVTKSEMNTLRIKNETDGAIKNRLEKKEPYTTYVVPLHNSVKQPEWRYRLNYSAGSYGWGYCHMDIDLNDRAKIISIKNSCSY
jgi:hypothetical protein